MAEEAATAVVLIVDAWAAALGSAMAKEAMVAVRKRMVVLTGAIFECGI